MDYQKNFSGTFLHKKHYDALMHGEYKIITDFEVKESDGTGKIV